MNRFVSVTDLRKKLLSGQASVGTWMQIPNASVAEILGSMNFDWVTVDLEHGAFSIERLPDIFRAIELGNTLPFARLSSGNAVECKRVLDAGAAGVIVPMISSAEQMESVISSCQWPPTGTRGVGFSRANLFGRRFEDFKKEASAPFIVAMIESKEGLEHLDEIVTCKGLDAILLGPYDLSASLGVLGEFDAYEFTEALSRVKEVCEGKNIPVGIHVVEASVPQLQNRISEGYKFVAYSIDTVMLLTSANIPLGEFL